MILCAAGAMLHTSRPAILWRAARARVHPNNAAGLYAPGCVAVSTPVALTGVTEASSDSAIFCWLTLLPSPAFSRRKTMVDRIVKAAEHEECEMDAVNHLCRIGAHAVGDEEDGGEARDRDRRS